MSRLLLLTAVTLLLGACSSATDGQENQAQAAMDGTEAVITEIDVRPSTISIGGVEVWVSGFFTNTCARIDSSTQQFDDETFIITMTTARTAQEGCELEQSANFVQILDLDVRDLEAGEYKVNVNGFSGDFEITADGIAE